MGGSRMALSYFAGRFVRCCTVRPIWFHRRRGGAGSRRKRGRSKRVDLGLHAVIIKVVEDGEGIKGAVDATTGWLGAKSGRT